MRKTITYLLTLIILFTFTACGSENQNGSGNSFLDLAKKEKQEAKEHELSETLIKKDDDSKEHSLENNYTEKELKNALKSEAGKEPTDWFYDDFDLDGNKEAFAVIANKVDEYQNEFGSAYFVDWKGKVIKLPEVGKGYYTTSILTEHDTDGYKFLSLALSAGGSGGTGYLYGVKKDTYYSPQVSGGYYSFTEENNQLNAVVSVLGWDGENKTPDGSGHFWIPCPMTFDESTKEFSVDETKATPPNDNSSLSKKSNGKYPDYISPKNLNQLGKCAFVCTYENQWTFLSSDLYITESIENIGVLDVNENNNEIEFYKIESYNDTSCQTDWVASTGYSPDDFEVSFRMFNYKGNHFYGATEQLIINSYYSDIGLVNIIPRFELSGTLSINRPLSLLPLEEIDWSTIEITKANNGCNLITFELKNK